MVSHWPSVIRITRREMVEEVMNNIFTAAKNTTQKAAP